MIGIKSIASYVPADGIDNYAQGAKFAKDEEFIIGKKPPTCASRRSMPCLLPTLSCRANPLTQWSS